MDKTLPKFKNYTGQPVNWIQPKLDGHYTKVLRDCSGKFIITSKKPLDITEKVLAVPNIKAQLQNMPNNSIALCELHCPEEDATSVPTLLNAADEKLMLTVFAVPIWEGLEWGKRKNDNLDYAMDLLATKGFSVAHTTHIDSDFVGEKGCDLLNELAVKSKFEGHVLKVSHMEGWYKLKPVRELDAVVNATFMSTCDSFYGMLQSVNIFVYAPDGSKFNLGNCGIGLLEEKLKYDTQAKRDTLIGRVMEVHYDKVGAKGGLRFPRFHCWKDDKTETECTTEQFDYYKGKQIR